MADDRPPETRWEELLEEEGPPGAIGVSGRTETKTYGSAADMLAFQIFTGRKSLW
jgi:hypothetical protein